MTIATENINFCQAADPFETVKWVKKSAQIKGENGELIFEQTDCEVPETWSQLATNIVCSKYFYGENGTAGREKSVKQLIRRVALTIAEWGLKDGYFDTPEEAQWFYRELAWLCLHQHGSFNSPVWFNVGIYHHLDVKGSGCNWRWDEELQDAVQEPSAYVYPQASACFIQHVDDTMEDIMELARSEAMLFKCGSGTGTDLSTIRSSRELLSGGGAAAGPLAFMRVYDQIAAIVRSGGKTRRAAKMQSLRVDHPDVVEFIECKWKEEQKARVLIEKGGYESNFNGEAYKSILYQNANLSVRVTDDFMQAVESGGQWSTKLVTNPHMSGPTYGAREIMDRMAECAWHCGDPGVQYHSTINKWHPCPNSGEQRATNPCSEYSYLDDTACNLASINLMKFRRKNGTFDVDRYRAANRIFFIAQEILVDNASYPTYDIAVNSRNHRPIGLGYTNIGSYLMSNGLPYDSDEGRAVAAAITAIMHGSANLTSSEIAKKKGTFAAYEENQEPFMRVMNMHRNALNGIGSLCPPYLAEAADNVWAEVIAHGEIHGFRNAQATVLAPTGTISFMMDCDTTGVEPDIALVKYKQLAGGGMLKIVNQTVRMALKSLNYSDDAIVRIMEHIDTTDTIEGASDLLPEHLEVFDCAFKPKNGERSIRWQAHVLMMAAVQPFLSGAISKTVNMPAESTKEDIAAAYIDGWRVGLKALAIYRDGSKSSQPMSTSTEAERDEQPEAKPIRNRLPNTRQSITHKFDVAGHEGYITVGLYPDGKPGEVFITMAKEGSTVAGLTDVLGTAISMSLQYGVPMEDFVTKFSHVRFEPQGFSRNPEIGFAKSIIDYIFRWLGLRFPAEAIAQDTQAPQTTHKEHSTESSSQTDAPACATCGCITVRSGRCYLCHNCGTSAGCS